MNLFIALDQLNKQEEDTINTAKKLAQVEGEFGFKVNLDHFIKKGAKSALEPFQQIDKPIFADLKMWNGRRTMTSSAQELVQAGADYVTVHGLADWLLERPIGKLEGSDINFLAVSLLTHYGSEYAQRYFDSQDEAIRTIAQRGEEIGADGLVLPPTKLDLVEDTNLTKVVPGIRPTWYQDDRHKEEKTPAQAFKNGADIIVCGSPIMKTEESKEALQKILDEIPA